MLLDSVEYAKGDTFGRFLPAGGEAGPVVEVDQFHFALFRHDAVAAIDGDVERFRRFVGILLELFD